MRYVRFLGREGACYGRLTGPDTVETLPEAPWDMPAGDGAPGERLKLDGLRLLAPSEPGSIVCVGKNYLDHIQEFDRKLPETPIIFLKPRLAANDPGGFIDLPPESMSGRIDYEGELAFVVGKLARRVPEDRAREHIFGFTLFNDVTARDLQHKDGQWTRGKGFDGFAPFGPWIDDAFDPAGKSIQTRLNGQTVQSGRIQDMIWGVDALLSFISGFMTLLPGDIVATGTPSGVGPMKRGDVVEIVMEGLGVLRSTAR